MTAFAGAFWQAHIADRHQCCWIMDVDLCGLWCGHDGDHLSYTPGDYLPEPMLHPLALWNFGRTWATTAMRCPVCGNGRGSWGLSWEVVRSGLFGRQVGDEVYLSHETLWRFEPCGCEAREIHPT